MSRRTQPRPILAERELDGYMDRLAGGDRDAFEPLYRELRPRAVRLSRRSVIPAEVPDLAQTILLKVFARASDFRTGWSVLPWFYAIAANEIRTATRRLARARRIATESVDQDEHGVALAEEQLIQLELLRALEAAITELDSNGAEAIGAMLGRTEPPRIEHPAFRKRVSRAYARLRHLLRGMR